MLLQSFATNIDVCKQSATNSLDCLLRAGGSGVTAAADIEYDPELSWSIESLSLHFLERHYERELG